MNTPKNLGRGLLTTTETTFYTVPTGTKTILKNIVLTSFSSTNNRTADVKIGTNSIVYRAPVKASDTVVIDMSIVLDEGDTISAFCDSLNGVTLFLSGVEVTA